MDNQRTNASLKIISILVLCLVALVTAPHVCEVELQTTAFNLNALVPSATATVTLHDAATGGAQLYSDTHAITDSRLDDTLVLNDLNYGDSIFLDVSIDGTDQDFGSGPTEREAFKFWGGRVTPAWLYINQSIDMNSLGFTELATLAATAGNNIAVTMGDPSGANKISFMDSSPAEVASINSDGDAAFTDITATSFSGDCSSCTAIGAAALATGACATDEILDGTILDADVSATADIAPTKIDWDGQRWGNLQFNGGFESPLDNTHTKKVGGWEWYSPDAGNWDAVNWQSTTVHSGRYAVQLSSTGSPSQYALWRSTWDTWGWDFERFKGETLTFSCAVNCDTASAGRLRIQDNVGGTSSPYHTGGGDWETLTATYTLDASATSLGVIGFNYLTGGASDCYYDSCQLCEGTTCPGAWEPGTVTCFDATQSTDIYSATAGDVALTSLDVDAVGGLYYPANAVAVKLLIIAQSDEPDCVVNVYGGDDEATAGQHAMYVVTQAAGTWTSQTGTIRMDVDGEIDYVIDEADADNDFQVIMKVVGWCVHGGI